MARILFIDDDQDVGKFTKESIEKFHQVDWIRADYWQTAESLIVQIKEPVWDLLLLDLAYPTDIWGGIWLFNSLARKGFRDRWSRREIVYSKHFAQNSELQRANDGFMFGLRVFLDSANIPLDCALPNQSFDRVTLLEKIEEVLKR